MRWVTEVIRQLFDTELICQRLRHTIAFALILDGGGPFAGSVRHSTETVHVLPRATCLQKDFNHEFPAGDI